MVLDEAFEFLVGLKSWRARTAYLLASLSKRIGLPAFVHERLEQQISGTFVGSAGSYDLRPRNLDFATVHPAHEKETHKTLRAVCQKGDGMMIDVGGFCGGFGLRYKDWFERILIFEPFPENADAIERNIYLSGVANKVMLVRAAVASFTGKRKLYLSSNDTHSLIVGAEDRAISVDVVNLDGILQNIGALHNSVRLLKIDVEGGEIEVLEGATKILRQSRPVVVAEANNESDRLKLEAFMRQHGYEVYRQCDHRNFVFRPLPDEDSK